ncbi:MAG: BlaI/MecI/CopY family transcriptional regulator [Clostridiales bacterium]|nr:BlaI/MecI/CopY family transcriptional regulator [Clostridiales bacterium]
MERGHALTDVEWRLMQCLWKGGAMTLGEIMADVSRDTSWTKHSVISFLKRMAAKGYVDISTERPIRYRTLLDQHEAMRTKTRQVLKNVFDNNLVTLVRNAVIEQPLSDVEVDELIDLLKKGREK